MQIPVLADLEWQGEMRKLMLWGNRNGFYYVLDRETGKFLLASRSSSRPGPPGWTRTGVRRRLPAGGPSKDGTLTWPGVQGGTNWYAPSYSPVTNLFYLAAWEGYYGIYYKWDQKYEPESAIWAASRKG